MRRRGGGGGDLLCCSFSVNRKGLLQCCLVRPPGVFCSLFSFCFRGFLCRSVFVLLCLLLRCPVLASLLRVFFLLLFVASPTVGCLSSFSLVVVRFACVSFFSLGVCLFLWWPTLPPPCVSPLGSPYFLSPAVACYLFRCR